VLVTLLNPLEADGYVSRQRDPADRRRHVVAVSQAGGQHLAAAAHAQRAAEDELFAALDTNQREQLRQLLLALQANLHPDQAPRCSPQPPTTARQRYRSDHHEVPGRSAWG
jgi:DNA-binding PadR family transcriptional regulator